ncbi:hemagglutinin repeat-containing protein [Xanthomonas oryzae pv. oryzicola]|uniref:hemagglutinin repeat-containing protein n=3 Tax=Xanthomonas oryzae TaxID=347 RepID=UPI003D176293
MGFATNESSFNSSSQISQGSTITGGGNVRLKTTEGDLHIVQGNIKAGDTLSLDSARDLVLDAGNSSNTEQSKGSNAGFEVGVGASVGAQTGVYAYVQASAGSHKSNVDGSTWQNTQLAGQNIVLKSEGDTTLRGAVVKGDRIDAQVGGDLTIESLQDKLDIQSKESSVGGRVQISAGTAWDASGYASGAKANGSYLGVVEQSGLFAGNGGYHVTAGNVNLIGGAIASTNAGASELAADSLTFTDLKNQMDYSASSGSISGGFGSTGNQTDANGNPIERTAGEQSRDIGSNIANGNYGKANTPSMMPGVPMHESGSDTTYTRATLTEGTIKIGGKTTTAAATGINTDATAAHEAVATLPDVRKILGEQQAMAAAATTVVATSKQIGDDIAGAAESKANAIEAQYRESLDTQDKKDAFKALTADQRRDVLAQSNPDYSAAYDSKQHWGVGGDYSRALQAVTSVVVGGVSGQGGGQIATNALAPYAAQLIGKTFDQNHGSDPNAVLQGLSHAVLGAVLAEVNGGSIAGGALAGAAGELGAKYLTQTLYGDDPRAIDPVTGKFNPNLLPEQDKQMIVALSQAVGAIAGGMMGGKLNDALVGSEIAGNAVENNYLSKNDVKIISDKLKQCAATDTHCRDAVVMEAKQLSAANDAKLKACDTVDCVNAIIHQIFGGARDFGDMYAADQSEDNKGKLAFGAISDMETKSLLLAANMAAGLPVYANSSMTKDEFLKKVDNFDYTPGNPGTFWQEQFEKYEKNIGSTKQPHEYSTTSIVCMPGVLVNCGNPAEQFDALRRYAGPGVDGKTLADNGVVSYLSIMGLSLGYVTHLIDPSTSSLINITVPNAHALDPGFVVRQVIPYGDGGFSVSTNGWGTGSSPAHNSNEWAADIIWPNNAGAIGQEVMGLRWPFSTINQPRCSMTTLANGKHVEVCQ